MKKPFLAIFLVWYMALTSGVAISFHYCMNRLDSTSVFAEADETCGKCGMHIEDAMGCCRDEVKLVKLDDDQQLTSLIHFAFSQPMVAEPLPDGSEILVAATRISSLPQAVRPPPPDTGPEIYLANRVFRI